MASQPPKSPKTGVPHKIAPGLRRVLAPNASPMTYWGTNTYLLGTRDIAVIDPGPPDEAHLAAILEALEAHQRISHIVVTHSHVDHSPLAMVLAQVTGAQVHGFGDSYSGRAPVMTGLSDLGGGEGRDETFLPDVTVACGDQINGSDWSLSAIHTPGHMGNHLCFHWPQGDALFSGDLVMGWATSMVSPPDGHLTDFMTSLERLMARTCDQVFFPGHGAPITEPAARLAELHAHRRMREGQILNGLKADARTPKQLTKRIYTDVAPALLPAAERNVLAHLIDLTVRGQVRHDGPLTATSLFFLAE